MTRSCTNKNKTILLFRLQQYNVLILHLSDYIGHMRSIGYFISRCYVVAMFDITTNALQTVRYQMPGAVAVRYLARYRTAIPQGN